MMKKFVPLNVVRCGRGPSNISLLADLVASLDPEMLTDHTMPVRGGALRLRYRTVDWCTRGKTKVTLRFVKEEEDEARIKSTTPTTIHDSVTVQPVSTVDQKIVVEAGGASASPFSKDMSSRAPTGLRRTREGKGRGTWFNKRRTGGLLGRGVKL